MHADVVDEAGAPPEGLGAVLAAVRRLPAVRLAVLEQRAVAPDTRHDISLINYKLVQPCCTQNTVGS